MIAWLIATCVLVSAAFFMGRETVKRQQERLDPAPATLIDAVAALQTIRKLFCKTWDEKYNIDEALKEMHSRAAKQLLSAEVEARTKHLLPEARVHRGEE